MRKTVALLFVLALTAAGGSPAEAASFKRCGSFTHYAGVKAQYQAKNISCRAAKKVLRNAGMTLCFDNQIRGWKKVWRGLPNGGKALTLTRGAKAIKTNACSPR